MSLIMQNRDAPLAYAQPPGRTWLLDHDAGRIRQQTDGLTAIAQAAYCALQTPRYQHLIYSRQYGSELQSLLGRDPAIVFSEAKRMIKDALSNDTRILSVDDFQMEGQVIRFTVETRYGSRRIETGVQST